jgi:hypothetical protein
MWKIGKNRASQIQTDDFLKMKERAMIITSRSMVGTFKRKLTVLLFPNSREIYG